MYLTKSERIDIINAYDCKGLTEDNHYQVEPDTWVYLFNSPDGKKYVLIAADYLEYEFDHFPQLLRFDNDEFHKIDFILQREILSLDTKKTTNSALFEYTN